jgi:hypothetical protein
MSFEPDEGIMTKVTNYFTIPVKPMKAGARIPKLHS